MFLEGKYLEKPRIKIYSEVKECACVMFVVLCYNLPKQPCESYARFGKPGHKFAGQKDCRLRIACHFAISVFHMWEKNIEN
jgi:hypothetical protein